MCPKIRTPTLRCFSVYPGYPEVGGGPPPPKSDAASPGAASEHDHAENASDYPRSGDELSEYQKQQLSLAREQLDATKANVHETSRGADAAEKYAKDPWARRGVWVAVLSSTLTLGYTIFHDYAKDKPTLNQTEARSTAATVNKARPKLPVRHSGATHTSGGQTVAVPGKLQKPSSAAK